MSLSHSAQIKHKQQDAMFNPIYQFLDNIGSVQKQYSSFEQAEKAIKKLVGQIENSMVQETLSQ